MISKLNKSATVAIALLMSLTAFIAVVPMASATNDPPNDNGVHGWAKDWTVVDSRTLSGTTVIIMQQHNVTVANGGTLTIDHATLDFDGSKNGEIGIIVQKGGTFIMKNNAFMAPFTTKSWFGFFENGSTVSIDHSVIIGCTGKNQTIVNTGLHIATDKFTMEGSSIGAPANNVETIELVPGAKVVIQNTSIALTSGSAINVPKGAFIKIADSNIQGSGSAYQCIMMWGSNATLINNWIQNFKYNVISMDSNSYLYAKGNVITGSTTNGMWVNDHAKADLIQNAFGGNDNGVVVWGPGSEVVSSVNTFQNNNNGVSVRDDGHLTSTNDIFLDNNNNGLQLMHGKADVKKGTFHTQTGINIRAVLATDISSVDIGTSSFTDVGSSTGIWIEVGSSAEIHDNTIQGANYAVFGFEGATIHAKKNTFTNSNLALAASVDSNIQSEDNTFNSPKMSFYTDTNSNIVSKKDTVVDQPAFNVAAYGFLNSSMVFHQLKMNGVGVNSFGMEANTGCTIKVYDSDITNIGQAYRTFGGGITSINSTPTAAISEAFSDKGQIDIGWYGHVKTTWQNGVAAPNATVKFQDKNGTVMNTVTTDGTGNADMELIQTTVMKSGVYDRNTYNIQAALNGMTGRTGADVTTNMVGAKSITVMLQDTSAPELNITYPKEGNFLNTTDLTVSGNFSDTGSGIGGVILQAVPGVAVGSGKTSYSGFIFSLVNIPQGFYHIFVNVTDVSGNMHSEQVNVTIDRTVPTLTITKPAGLYSQTKTFNLNGTTEIGAKVTVNGTNVTNVNGTFGSQLTLPDGEHNIIVTSTDAAGNKAVVTKKVIVDTVPPTLTCDVANGTWISTTKFVLKGTSDGATVKYKSAVGEVNNSMDVIQRLYSFNLTLVEGANKMLLTATDLAGLSTTLELTINVDTVLPVLTLISPAGTGTFYTNKTTVVFSGKATDLNLQSVTVNGLSTTFDTMGNFTANIVLSAGPHTVTINASDKAGNIAKFNVAMVVDILIERVKITSPPDGSITKLNQVTVTGTIDDPLAKLKLGSTNVTNNNGTFTGTATLVVGINTITMTATDLAGNVGTTSIKVTYDNEAKLTVTKPTKDKISTTTTSITLAGTSELNAKIYINDVMITSDPSGTFTYKMLVKEGKTKVVVKSVDPAGNTVSKTLTATRTEAKQFEMTALLGVGIVLMIIGLLIGVVVGRMMAKPKKPKAEEEPEEAETKPAPKLEKEEEETEEEKEPFSPEEEEETPKVTKSAPKSGHVEDPVQDGVSKKTNPAPKEEPKPEPKAGKEDEDSLDSLLKDMEKGKK